MIRLFTGVALPAFAIDAITLVQGGLPQARWRPRENLHITLVFVGEVDGHTERDIDDALDRLSAPAFDMRLKGTGQFGKDRPHTLWAGVEDGGGLTHLAGKISTALLKLGVKLDRRKYMPHVTLAYLRDARRDAVESFVARHNDFSTDVFHVDRFTLYESHLGKGASHYVVRAEYGLLDVADAAVAP